MNPLVPAGLPQAVLEARRLKNAGSPELAVQLLHQQLRLLDPHTMPADQVLMEAAGLYSDLTADPAWTRYAVAARLTLPLPRQSRPPAQRSQPAADARPPVWPAFLADPQGARVEPEAAAPDPIDVLQHAQRRHAQGHCGNATRDARRAMDLCRGGDDGGHTVTLIWLTAMLCACRRDPEAELELLAEARELPAAGSPERAQFASYAIDTITRVSHGHDQVCMRWQAPPDLAILSTLHDDDPAAQHWAQRRHDWHVLLSTVEGPR